MLKFIDQKTFSLSSFYLMGHIILSLIKLPSITKKCLNWGIFTSKILYASSKIYDFKFMNLLASFALGGFNPWAAGFGIGSLVLFGLVGLVAGPNLKNFDPDA